MPLELSTLRKAASMLETALRIYEDPAVKNRPSEEREVLRAGVIQVFEYTYELCWKFMKRWLELNISPTVDGSTRKELFRLAAENKLISNVESWMDYHQSRNETSHVYDPGVAEDVYASVRPFLQDAKTLLSALEARND
jgi:nucleotidyltransferase substrate binding protein (TIGR01987 family)